MDVLLRFWIIAVIVLNLFWMYVIMNEDAKKGQCSKMFQPTRIQIPII